MTKIKMDGIRFVEEDNGLVRVVSVYGYNLPFGYPIGKVNIDDIKIARAVNLQGYCCNVASIWTSVGDLYLFKIIADEHVSIHHIIDGQFKEYSFFDL